MRIRGGAGLGDAIYLRAIAEHFVRAGKSVTVCSDYSDVFLGSGAQTAPFDRFNIDVLAHYTAGKYRGGTNQWQDICASAGVGDLPLKFSWQVRNQALVNQLLEDAGERPLVLVNGGRPPMARTDGFGAELLPEKAAFDAVLAAARDCFTVRVGKGPSLYEIPAVVDMNGGTSVSDILDIGSVAAGLIGQCSFVIPLAEAFDKPLLVVWSAAGMSSARHPYISSITPQKVLSKPSSRFVVDDWPRQDLERGAADWLEAVTAARPACAS